MLLTLAEAAVATVAFVRDHTTALSALCVLGLAFALWLDYTAPDPQS